MTKWQQENKEQRAVLYIATDERDCCSALFGKNLPLTVALAALMIKESDYENVCKGALIAKENPIAMLALLDTLEESLKGSEASPEEEKADPAGTSIKESLKTILTKLADKL